MTAPTGSLRVPCGLVAPPRECSVMPFWFWNDDLDEREILRQMEDFADHGVYGFVIHPRVGLPRSIGFMSERMAHFVRFAVGEAARRDMKVVLYDEGMYPSGSASGLVVQADATHRCRGLARIDVLPGEEPRLEPGWNVVAEFMGREGRRQIVVDRPVGSCIRGLHYIGDGPEEDLPPAADILNPDAVRSFIRIVYDGYHRWVGEHFGRTVLGLFTDEPSLLGRRHDGNVMPGTTGVLDHVNRILGRDFTPELPALWDDAFPDAEKRRRDYRRALSTRVQETYYRPLHDWCAAHNVSLMGHPSAPDDIGCERWFQVPGQDLVWRKVLAGEPSAIEGEESTQGKCSSSAMIHLRRRRNSNELYGAYGHQLTWDEMKSLADWCFVRGVNLLMPHAFYYSVRGPRRDERPPDVGPNSPWWDRYRGFADYCARLSWLNTDTRHVCGAVILGEPARLPWRAARVCFQRQRDFNYLEARHLWEDAAVDEDGIRLAGMEYRALIVEAGTDVPRQAAEAMRVLRRADRVIEWSADGPEEALVKAIDRRVPRDLAVVPEQPDLRCRHVAKDGLDYYLLVNEGRREMQFTALFGARGRAVLFDPMDGAESPLPEERTVRLAPFGSVVVIVRP